MYDLEQLKERLTTLVGRIQSIDAKLTAKNMDIKSDPQLDTYEYRDWRRRAIWAKQKMQKEARIVKLEISKVGQALHQADQAICRGIDTGSPESSALTTGMRLIIALGGIAGWKNIPPEVRSQIDTHRAIVRQLVAKNTIHVQENDEHQGQEISEDLDYVAAQLRRFSKKAS